MQKRWILSFSIIFLVFLFIGGVSAQIKLSSLSVEYNENFVFDQDNYLKVIPLDINQNITAIDSVKLKVNKNINYTKEEFLRPNGIYEFKLNFPYNESIDSIPITVSAYDNGKVVTKELNVPVMRGNELNLYLQNFKDNTKRFASFVKENVEYFFVGTIIFVLGGLLIILNKK